MIRMIVTRLLGAVVVAVCVATLGFFALKAAPGGPFDAERRVQPEVQRNIERAYHLDWPLWKQYLQYLGPFNLDERGVRGTREDVFGGVLVGDLGPSFAHRDLSVNDVIAQSLPISITLGLLALLVAIGVGLPLGILSAAYPRSPIDHLARLVSTLGIVVPNFVIAAVLILLFVFTVPLFPVAGWGSWRHLVLPALALGLPFAAYVARLARTGMREALQRPHIRTAEAKGLPRSAIVLRHALREGILPVVSYLGPTAAGILTGSLVIEKIFFLPGTGTHFVNSALNRDYTLAMGVTILYTALVFALNTLVDLAYGLLDPRIRMEER
jgi:oligopeptide transport system permease protein